MIKRRIFFGLIVSICTLGGLITLADWRASTLASRASVAGERTRLAASVARLEAEKQMFVLDDLTGLIWEGLQSAEVTAKVQSALNDTARQNGIVMRSIAPANQRGQAADVLGFRLEFEASLPQLVAFLKEIEFGRPPIIITRANMRRLVRANQEEAQPVLFVQIDVNAPVLRDDEVGE